MKPQRITAPDSPNSDCAASALKVVEEDAPVFEGVEYARIKPGQYSGQCVYFKVYYDRGFKRWTAMLRFQLIDEEEEIYGFLNLGRRERPHAGRRSRYWAEWTLANGATPRKRQEMSPRVFRGKVFLVEVGDVTKAGDGKSHQACAIYSTVKKIIEKQVG
jgi:hypothetical protein